MAADRQRPLLEIAGDVDRPALVAEVALELADDRGSGEAREFLAAPRLESLDGVQQPDRGDLDEVIQWLAAVYVAQSELARERQKAPDQLLPDGRLAVQVVGLEQLFIGQPREIEC